jgi:predicted Fe-Mo cluster-binding NifX family protein
MKVCIPVAEDRGLESLVYGHFGSAPLFMLVDSETMSVASLGNRDQAHVHGQCSPVQALAGARPDAVVVGGIGGGALLGLRGAGIKVYRSSGGTVAQVVQQLQAGELPEMSENSACSGHAGGHRCHGGHAARSEE